VGVVGRDKVWLLLRIP